MSNLFGKPTAKGLLALSLMVLVGLLGPIEQDGDVRKAWATTVFLLAVIWGLGRAMGQFATAPRNLAAIALLGALSVWVMGLTSLVAILMTIGAVALAAVWPLAAVMVPVVFVMSAHLGLSVFEHVLAGVAMLAALSLVFSFAAPVLAGPKPPKGSDGKVTIYDLLDAEEA